MTLLSCLIIQLLWAFCVKGQVKPCDYPHIENGALTRTYEYYKDQIFPAMLGTSIQYQCDRGYTPKNEERYARCTVEGWTPKPQCFNTCKKIEVQNGYFSGSKDKFNFNEEAKYGCDSGYKTSEGNEEGKTQCLQDGWAPLPKCFLALPCEEPPVLDFGGIVSSDKLEYRQGDKVQYKCNPGYTLMGPEWITCNGKAWTPAPQCLAPCIITKQQLEAKNLLLSNGRRYAQLIQSEHTVEFMCSEGYALITPSVRMCVNGHLDLPSCISETGKNCSRPPTLENGDITTFLKKEYTSGSFVEFKCQKLYAIEGQNRSFCDNGNWTKTPVCLEPCAISVEEMGNHMVELNESANENIPQWVYLNRGDFLELRCQSGYSLATNLSESTFMVQCNGNPIVYPECREIVCNLPGVVSGRFRPERNIYKDGDVIIITCNRGFHNHNGQNTAECTGNGWFPPPRCTQDK